MRLSDILDAIFEGLREIEKQKEISRKLAEELDEKIEKKAIEYGVPKEYRDTYIDAISIVINLTGLAKTIDSLKKYLKADLDDVDDKKKVRVAIKRLNNIHMVFSDLHALSFGHVCEFTPDVPGETVIEFVDELHKIALPVMLGEAPIE